MSRTNTGGGNAPKAAAAPVLKRREEYPPYRDALATLHAMRAKATELQATIASTPAEDTGSSLQRAKLVLSGEPLPPSNQERRAELQRQLRAVEDAIPHQERLVEQIAAEAAIAVRTAQMPELVEILTAIRRALRIPASELERLKAINRDVVADGMATHDVGDEVFRIAEQLDRWGERVAELEQTRKA